MERDLCGVEELHRRGVTRFPDPRLFELCCEQLENLLLDSIRGRASAAGFEYLSTLIEARTKESGPVWLQEAAVLERFENYLGSGTNFLYLQAPLSPQP